MNNEVSAPAIENLLDLTPEQARTRLERFFAERGEPAYRARQVLPRLWVNPVSSFEEITDLPKRLREALAATFAIPRLTIAARQKSTDGTEKFLFTLADGQGIETVAIPEGGRLTLCISSQA